MLPVFKNDTQFNYTFEQDYDRARLYEIDLKPLVFDEENDTISIALNKSISNAVVLN